ncbi:hypothetical protein [Streptosporangium sp. NPDC000396]|uniref:hypothetical protein n=1 Tax=Streptosporangium sp. NPDC000396 TaxID=3366185 RepID=UPI0036856E76
MGRLTPERLEQLESDRRSRYATRGRRRVLVGAGAGSAGLVWVSAIVCWYLAPSDAAMWTTFALSGVALMIYVVVYGTLVIITRGVIGLDERQLRQRQKIQVDARRGTTAILLALGLALLLSIDGDKQVVQVPAAAIVMLLSAVIMTHLILPALMAGWQMADPPPDDEDD